MSHPQVYNIHGDLMFVTADGVKVDIQVGCAVQQVALLVAWLTG